MIAGILGDIIGSVYEGSQWQIKNLSLIKNDNDKIFIKPILNNLSFVRKDQSWTDDTLCTLALCDAYMNKKDYAKTLQYYCKKYGDITIGFGKSFNQWVENPIPYESYGNGALMRIGFIQKLKIDLNDKLHIGYECTKISHNHIDSFNAVNDYLLIAENIRNTKSKEYINVYLEENNIIQTVEDLHNECVFNNTVIKTLQQALIIVKESNSIEEVLINSCYVGGDVDTIACIACNLASELYEIPSQFDGIVENKLSAYEDLMQIYDQYKKLI